MKILLALPLLGLLGVTLATPSLRKREASEEAENNRSESCSSINGVKTCRICENGRCYTTNNGKREASGFSGNEEFSNCNTTTCWHCMGGAGYCGDHCCYYYPRPTPERRPLTPANNTHVHPLLQPFCTLEGCYWCSISSPDDCMYVPFKKHLIPQNRTTPSNAIGKPYPFCTLDGCNYCDVPSGRGNCVYKPFKKPCNSTGCWKCVPRVHGGQHCIFVHYLDKREAAQNHVSSTNCDNHGCHICVNGDCHYEPRGKREEFGNSNGTFQHCNATGCTYCTGFGNCAPNCCKFTPYPGCNATGCIRCKGFGNHGDGCEFHRLDKRESAQNHVSSKNCDNHGCHICVNGNCHYEPSKREASEALEQNHSSSTNCSNGRCTHCVNGSCTHYDE